jgi:hypothetical protein
MRLAPPGTHCLSCTAAAVLETVAFLITIGIVKLQVIEAIRDVRIRILCLLFVHPDYSP